MNIQGAWIVVGSLSGIFSSEYALIGYVESFGIWAPLVFFLLQSLQVVIAPIPGNITGLAGGVLFGAFKGFLLNGTGLLTGSIIAFFLARRFGKPLVFRIVGEVTCQKYGNIFSRKYFYIIFIIFLIPFFPDDALCFLAGLSSMPFPIFVLMVLTGRMPGMLVSSLVGSGVLHLSLLQWVIVGVISLGIIFLVTKYRGKIEDYLYSKLKLDKLLE